MLKYKYRDGLLPNSLAFTYVFAGYPLAIAGLFDDALWPLACLWLGHILVIAAYLFHECAHNTLFATAAQNAFVGKLLVFITGGCYSGYNRLREKHVRHHVQRKDILAVDAHLLLQKKPFLKKIIRRLTWFYIPAFEVYTHWLATLAPFYIDELKEKRGRVMVLMLLRGSLFLLLAIASLKAAVLYLLAWLLMVLVLNFMDAFQHSYQIRYSLLEPQVAPVFDADYEEQNTYTNLISESRPWLNLLVLNFCYHNAHHHKPNEPWYRLPVLHKKYYPGGCQQRIAFSEQVKRFHQYRIARLGEETSISNSGADSAKPLKTIDVAGTDGVNFLVGV